ncbi:MAG: glycine oxidase ThiO, partial [Acidobacteriota bacterium]|nr:glycine oxidase ThiO [Acidobacteriota bacterium]
GIIGLTLADALLRRGRQVMVIERDRPGCGSTWAAGGMLAPISEAEHRDPDLLALAQRSLESYPRFVHRLEGDTGLQCGYSDQGSLWVAGNRDDREELNHLRQTLEQQSLRVETLDGEHLSQLEPHLSGRVQFGLRVDGDHQVDPRALVLCLEQSIRSRGGKIVSGARVEEILEHGGRVRGVAGQTRRGESFRLEADEVVLAAGAWSARGIRLPIEPIDVRPVKGQLLRLRGETLLRHVVRTPDVYLIPRADGELLVGATMEEMGFDSTPTAGPVMDLLRHAWEILPGTYDLELAEICVGLRPALDDQRPAIGPTSVSGLFLAVGHFRNGVLLAPATAAGLADWIVDDVEPDYLRAFHPRLTASVGESS